MTLTTTSVSLFAEAPTPPPLTYCEQRLQDRADMCDSWHDRDVEECQREPDVDFCLTVAYTSFMLCLDDAHDMFDACVDRWGTTTPDFRRRPRVIEHDLGFADLR